MDLHVLEDIGLTKGESRVYWSLLRIGESSTGKIIKESQISSGKIYQILDKLIKKGLVGYSVRNNIKYFSVSSPARIIDYLQNQQEELHKKEEKIKDLLPSLLKEHDTPDYDAVFFSGYEGIRSVISETLEKIDDNTIIDVMGIQTERDEKYNLLWINWHRQRIKKKIKCKMIFSGGSLKYLDILKKMEYTEIKTLRGITPSAVSIIGNRTLIFTYHDIPGCLSITSKEIATSFLTFFNSLWAIGRK